MILDYCNQNITLKTKGSVNEYNEPTYTTTTVRARFEYKRRKVRNSAGEEVLSEASCYLATAVKPGDVISYDGVDWVIIATYPAQDLFGAVSHYEAML